MRRANDFYPTPAWATEELLHRITPLGRVLEPCSGDRQIADVLERFGFTAITNDIDPAFEADTHVDATDPDIWFWADVDWVVSNPPYSLADVIVPLAVKYARKGVAMLLRISWLEPCLTRDTFLKENPPRLIVLPRISFTGDGKTDNVTTAWFVWEKADAYRSVEIVPRRKPACVPQEVLL